MALSRRGRFALTLGALGVLLVLAWRWTRAGHEQAGSTLVGVHERAARGATRDADALAKPVEGLASKAREPGDRGFLAIVDGRGRPIAGAEVRWVPWDDEWLDVARRASPKDYSILDARSRVATSDESGNVRLVDMGDDDRQRASVLLVSALGFRARIADIASGGAASLPARVVLESGASIRVRVVDAAGTPVPRANVVHAPSATAAEAARMPERDAQRLRLLHRVDSADERGEVTIPELAPFVQVIATTEVARSVWWFGGAPADVTLQIVPSFTLQGRVIARQDGGALGAGRISCLRWRGNDRMEVGRLAVRADGAFGPSPIPILDASQYSFQVEGGGFVAEEAKRDVPMPGELVTLDLEVHRGIDLRFRILDESREPQVGAVVSVHWMSGTEWRSASAISDASGDALVAAIEPGALWIRASKEGYREHNQGNVVHMVATTEPIEVLLARGARLAGRVTDAGKPVESFSIFVWQGDVQASERRDFERRADGTFEWSGVPSGEVRAFAATPEGRRSEVRSVMCAPDANAQLELSIGAGTRTTGRVIDANTLEPVRGAHVQPWVTQDGLRLAAAGGGARTDETGAFALDGLASGSHGVEVNADGYATRVLTVVTPRDDDSFLVSLERSGSLEVRARSADGGSLTGYRVRVEGATRHAEVELPSSGTHVVDEVAPGIYAVALVHPDLSIQTRRVRVRAGKSTRLDFEPAGQGVLEVTVDAEAGAKLDAPRFVRASWTNGIDSMDERAVPLPVSNRATLTHVPPSALTLWVEDARGQPLASVSVPASSSPRREARIDMTLPARYVLVLDRERAPIAGCGVGAIDPTAAVGWYSNAVTDARGLAALPALASARARMRFVIAGSFAVSRGPVDLSSRMDDPTEFVLDPSAELVLDLRDGSVAVAGANLVLVDWKSSDWAAGHTTSNERGEALFRGLEPGAEFEVRIGGTGLWPTTWRGSVSEGRRVTVQVRRTGNVRLRPTISGTPLSDTRVMLRSVEFDVDVGAWINAELVSSSSPAQSTDSLGVLSLEGLPSGEYGWTVTGPDGRVDGVLVVEANTTRTLELVIR